MIDYLNKYVTPQGFDAPRLINDDFFLAIKTLFNAGFYVSAAKLLMILIDSVAFVSEGDRGNRIFCAWLGKYVDLSPVGITSEELWEHRNSLLHMTSSESRKVRSGKVCRLMMYVGTLPPGLKVKMHQPKFFNLVILLQAVGKGIGQYLNSLNNDPKKRESFIQRYDEILSDVRYERFELPDLRTQIEP